MTDAPDPFDPASLRLDQSFADKLGVRKLPSKVLVRRPHRDWYVRVHPDLNYRLTPAAIIEEDGDVYLVTPQIALEFPDEFTPVTLFTAINRQGVLFLLPVRLPGLDGKYDEWARSLMEAVEFAQGRWTRIKSNRPGGPMINLKRGVGSLSPNGPIFRLVKS
jgi:hypothetical protein